jgi:hypothetical protein
MSALSLGFIAGAIFGPGTLLLSSLLLYSLAVHVISSIRRRRCYCASEAIETVGSHNNNPSGADPRPWSLIKTGQLVLVYPGPSQTKHEEIAAARAEPRVS